MKHISQSEAEVFKKGAVTSYEYSTDSTTLNVAPIIIDGRYPESGFTKNTEVDAIVHVVSGLGKVGLKNGTEYSLVKNDQIHLLVDEAYYFEGSLEIIYAANPPWTPEQTEQV
jgi:hypothetical protein